MFSQVYIIFVDVLGYMSPIWDVLTTKVRELSIFTPDDGFLSQFLGAVWQLSVGWWTGISQQSVYDTILSAFGEFSLLQFTLGASIMTLISYYLIKFAMGLIS